MSSYFNSAYTIRNGPPCTYVMACSGCMRRVNWKHEGKAHADISSAAKRAGCNGYIVVMPVIDWGEKSR